MLGTLAMLALAAPAADSGGGDGPVVAILVAAFGAVGVIATALAPVLTEKLKRPSPPTTSSVPASVPGASATSSPPVPATVNPAPAAYTGDVFDLIEAQIADLRQQRDTAQAENIEMRRAMAQMQQRLWQYEGYGQHQSGRFG